MSDEAHNQWMEMAINLAKQAESKGEVPVGAILVTLDQIVGQGFNQPISSNDPTAHAEIVAIRAAALARKNYRLTGSTLYVTVEPCTMCIGAILHARIGTLVFGAREPRAGAVVSQQNLLSEGYYNHRVKVKEGVLADQCSRLLIQFFKAKRLAI